MTVTTVQKVRLAIIGISILFVLATFALLAYMTQERNSSHPVDGYSAYWISDPCSGSNATALTFTATYHDAYVTTVCPWGFWDLCIGFISVIVTLGFLGLIVIRRWKFSLKMLKLTLLLGLIGSILLILAFITLVNTINTQVTFDDYTNSNDVTTSYSQVECRSNAAMMFLSFLTVLALFLFEGWTYKKNADGLSSLSTIRGALI